MTQRLGKVSLAEVIRRAIEARLAEVRVSMPGTIESFDTATQLASVRPDLKELRFGEDDSEIVEPLGVISDVPVQFPRAGGFSLTVPVQKGDPCLLVFSDRSLDKWLDSGGQVDPVDERRHHLSDAVAILGVSSKATAIPSFDNAHATLGKDGESADFAALAQKVVDAIQGLTDAFLGHGHNVTTAGSATAQTGVTGKPQSNALAAPPVPPVTLTTPSTYTVPSVASTTVKIKG